MDIITPVGRIVWGNPLNGKDKTDNNNQIIIDPKTGQPVKQWAFGLALNKNECNQLFQAMQAEAATVFPNGAPQNFAWKFKDGDGLDDKGQPFNTREGYAGCIVISVVTEAFAPRVVRLVGGAYQQHTELKTGDYVRVALGIKAHAGKANVRGSVPGLYLNPQCVEFIGFGQEIISGPDAMSLFGGQAAALPPGASATPLAPVGMPPMGQAPGMMPAQGVPGMMQQPAQQYAPQGMQQPGMPGNVHTPAQQGAPATMPGMNGGAYSGAPAVQGGMQQPGMMPGNPQMPGNAQHVGSIPPGAQNMVSANGAMMSHSNPHNGFVNQMMPGMLPQQ